MTPRCSLGDDARSMGSVSESSAIAGALDLFAPARRPARLQLRDGYLDLLGDEDPTGSHPGQRLMASRALPLIYDRLWRPLGGRLLMGAMGPGMRGEHRIALEMLSLSGGERVLDVACGTGDFTRSFARASVDGVVVGLDASRTMLARAVQETDADNVAYVLGDACALPFRDGSFDAICCFAALYLIEHPMRAVDEIARVLAPGGRVALLASCNRGPLPAASRVPLIRRASRSPSLALRQPEGRRSRRSSALVPSPASCATAVSYRTLGRNQQGFLSSGAVSACLQSPRARHQAGARRS
jgi:SAM-dependent methyltransferase